MKQYNTETYQPVHEQETLWVYNGLDVCLTYEILDALLPLLNENTSKIYKWEFASQSLALEMMIRGLRVDRQKVQELLKETEEEYQHYLGILNRIAEATWDAPLNPNSPAQLKEFFYTCMGIKPVMYRGKVTTDRKAMEKIMEMNLYARPAAKLVLLLHDLNKILSVLKTEIDPDGR